jgi:hypothetical protein
MMKTATALAACLSLAIVASPAIAGSATPPPKPQKLSAVPPPPPGPGKLATPTKPAKTGPAVIVIFPSGKPPVPKPVDDFAGDTHKPGPHVIGSTFGPVQPPSPPPQRPSSVAQ